MTSSSMQQNINFRNIFAEPIQTTWWITVWKFRKYHFCGHFRFLFQIKLHLLNICNPLSESLPGKLHKSGAHSKGKSLQYWANLHRSQAWQIVLKFDTGMLWFIVNLKPLCVSGRPGPRRLDLLFTCCLRPSSVGPVQKPPDMESTRSNGM